MDDFFNGKWKITGFLLWLVGRVNIKYSGNTGLKIIITVHFTSNVLFISIALRVEYGEDKKKKLVNETSFFSKEICYGFLIKSHRTIS